MNHARARSRQLHREIQRGPQNRNRVVYPSTGAPFLVTAVDHACQRCGHVVCSCMRHEDPVVEQAKREAAEVPVLANAAAARPKGKARRVFAWRDGVYEGSRVCAEGGFEAYAGRYGVAYVFPGTSEDPGDRSIHDAIVRKNHRDRAEAVAFCEAELNRLLDEREGKAGRDEHGENVIDAGIAPGWAPRKNWTESYEHTTGARVWVVCSAWHHSTAGDPNISAGNTPTMDEAMARALGWKPTNDDGDVWWQSQPLPDGKHAHKASAERAQRVVDGKVERRTGFPSLPHAIAWARGEA